MLTCTADLEAIVADVRRDGIAALDTEFVWDRTFVPALGLVQLGGAKGEAWLLDALSPADPAPLAALLADGQTVKILHDAKQDLTLLARYCGAAPRNVFDTRIAAGFAGLSSTTSLQQVLRDMLGVELAKTETRTDWCRRPLSDAQVEYALDDVRHMADLRDALLAAVRERGAESWLEEELRGFDDPAIYADRPPEEAWLRVKGSGRLPPVGRAILRELAALREKAAVLQNQPRNWLISDEALVTLSFQPPATAVELRDRRLLHPNQLGGLSAGILEAIQRAQSLPSSEFPPSPHLRVDDDIKKRADEALVFLRAKGEALRIDAALFGSRAQVTAFAANPGDAAHPLSQGWRYETAGRELAARWTDGQTHLAL
jgi:ribonuclease D